MHVLTVRKIRVASLIFCGLLIVGLLSLRLYAWRVNTKAERLQNEVLQLRPGVTTLSEVRDFVNRTERPSDYAGYDGPRCDDVSCVVSVGPMAFLQGWRWPLFRRLGFLGIRPVDYGAIVEVRGGVVYRVVSSMFYSTGPNRISSADVILVRRFSDEDVGSTAVLDRERGIALCSNHEENESGVTVRYAAVGIAPNKESGRIALNLSCVTSLRECRDSQDFFVPSKSSDQLFISGHPTATCAKGAEWYYP